jgi:hypothetical protein
VWLSHDGQRVRTADAPALLAQLARQQVVLLGETHDSAEDHRWQLLDQRDGIGLPHVPSAAVAEPYAGLAAEVRLGGGLGGTPLQGQEGHEEET